MILLLLLLGARFNLANVVPKIVGGDKTDIREFPSFVSLMLKLPNRPGPIVICGGTYIRELWILTAAHCLVRPRGKTKLWKNKEISVRMGMSSLNDTYQQRQPVQLLKHDHYPRSSVSNNDIGLIKIRTKFKLNDRVSIATMVNTPDFPPSVVVVGFGNVQPNTAENLPPSFYLRKVELEAEIYRTYLKCYDPTPRGACFGDSGGPVYLRESGMLAGIVSKGNCYKGLGIFVNVFGYRMWIWEGVNVAFRIHSKCRYCVVYSMSNLLISSVIK